ncbi:MAG: CofH family radical SAM protein [Bacteroidetes bacterium]|nr:CofH family radical SAM protein [Bacteroidota bacterium]
MQTDQLISKALSLEFLDLEEGAFLYRNAPLPLLMWAGHELRKKHVPGNKVTWIIDRNTNTTNVCVANCKFCNFFVPPGDKDSYITTMDMYKQKIEELFRYGGEQLLLQGGHHPELGLKFYTGLFRELKKLFPSLKLHALGPPEIVHITQLDKLPLVADSYNKILSALVDAGLDSLPGAGAEILSDRVRKQIAQGKCTSGQWLDVMRAAHTLGLTTTATMMIGTVEAIEERIQHLISVREVQEERPAGATGFIAFIPWTFQDEGTILAKVKGIKNSVTPDEYIRMVAISRIMLPDITNIQTSWLTMGKKVGQICLHSGANDFGSVMIEENVVSAAGAKYRFSSRGIQKAIREAGFEPQLRNQHYRYREMPAMMEEQEV